MTPLHIQVKDGQCINHPAFTENLFAAFGEIPADWFPFTRVAQPTSTILPVGPYQIAEETYVPDGDGWKDSWSVRDMTPEEKQAKIDGYSKIQPFPSWTFDADECKWKAPVEMPSNGAWLWNEDTLSWKDVTPPPLDLSVVSFA